jgi:SAM-dependent methyltransferase
VSVDPGIFDAYYYAHGCGEPYQRSPAWLALFNAIAERIAQDIQPASVLDAGCAIGLLVECLRQRGIAAWGIDVSEYAIQNVSAETRPYCRVASVADALDRDYDLIVSIEVLEHMHPQEAQAAITNFCQHSDDILFSSTPFDYKEASHFNVQPPEAWAELFARHGFYRDVDFDASFITPWAVRFRRSSETAPRLVRNYERRFWLLWKENTDLRKLALEMRNQLAEGEQALQASRENVQALQAQIEQKFAEIQALQARLEALTGNRAWRFTQSLRRLLGRGE